MWLCDAAGRGVGPPPGTQGPCGPLGLCLSSGPHVAGFVHHALGQVTSAASVGAVKGGRLGRSGWSWALRLGLRLSGRGWGAPVGVGAFRSGLGRSGRACMLLVLTGTLG